MCVSLSMDVKIFLGSQKGSQFIVYTPHTESHWLWLKREQLKATCGQRLSDVSKYAHQPTSPPAHQPTTAISNMGHAQFNTSLQYEPHSDVYSVSSCHHCTLIDSLTTRACKTYKNHPWWPKGPEPALFRQRWRKTPPSPSPDSFSPRTEMF